LERATYFNRRCANFLATDIFNHSGFSGWVLVTLGIAIELAGITIKHK